MSYYTSVEFFYSGDDEFDLAEIEGALPEILDKHVVSRDVTTDLLELLRDGRASVKLFSDYIDAIVADMAKIDPDVAFVIRGFGEAPLDVWAREFRNGTLAIELGPPANAI